MRPRDHHGEIVDRRDIDLDICAEPGCPDVAYEECAWCYAPAVEQVPAGHAYRGRAWVRVYLWLCDQCKAEVQRAKEDSRRDD